jgi:AcrR family transcriptional regulator
MPDFGRYLRREHNRERLIDATLELCAAFGYESTTVDQIAAAANIAPDHFVDYFEDKDAVLMAVLDDAQQAIAAAFVHVGDGINPEQALLTAAIEVLAAINAGRGVTTVDRLAIVAQIVQTHADLERQASAARKQLITQALADRTGVDTQHATVRPATTTRTTIDAAPSGTGASYDSVGDDQLAERMTAELTAAFFEVTRRPTPDLTRTAQLSAATGGADFSGAHRQTHTTAP